MGPSDQYVTSLTVGPTGLVAGTLSAGVIQYRTDRARWSLTGLRQYWITSLALGSTNRLFATLAARGADSLPAVLLASDDAGASWRELDGGLAGRFGGHKAAYSILVVPSQSEVLYLGADAILRSLEGGTTWSYVYGAEGASIGAVLALTSQPGTGRIWAGGTDGFVRPFVLRSDDGMRWTVLRPLGLATENRVLSLLADASNNDRVLVSTSAGVLLSEDAGLTWRASLATQQGGYGVYLAATRDAIIAVSSEIATIQSGATTQILGFYRSRDGALTWEAIGVPSALGATALAVDSAGAVYVGTQAGVWVLDRL